MENDLAYAAGLIDGEGSIQIVKHRDPTCRQGYKLWLNVTVSMCDPEAVEWANNTFGGSLYTPKAKTSSGRTIYRWSVTTRAAANFLKSIRPFLKVKAEVADIAIAFSAIRYMGSRKPQANLDAQEAFYVRYRETVDARRGGLSKKLGDKNVEVQSRVGPIRMAAGSGDYYKWIESSWVCVPEKPRSLWQRFLARIGL